MLSGKSFNLDSHREEELLPGLQCIIARHREIFKGGGEGFGICRIQAGEDAEYPLSYLRFLLGRSKFFRR